MAFGAIGNIQKLVQGLTGGDDQSFEPSDQGRQQSAPARPARSARPARPKHLDDATITDKVETTLFRDSRIDKGKIDVNTVDGVVWLRGEAKTPEQIKNLEAKARAIPEVRDVENLLHLPKTTARKKPRATGTPRKRTPKRTTAERKTTAAATPNAEPTPAELASRGEGRQPAPMGSTGSGNGSGSGSGSGSGTGSGSPADAG